MSECRELLQNTIKNDGLIDTLQSLCSSIDEFTDLESSIADLLLKEDKCVNILLSHALKCDWFNAQL